MKVRTKETGEIAHSGNFNTHGLSEIIVYFFDGDCTSDFIHNYEVYLERKNEWKPLDQAFKDKDVIPDNYNTMFREAKNKEEKERGWF